MLTSNFLLADSTKYQRYFHLLTSIECFGNSGSLRALAIGIFFGCLLSIPTLGQGKGAPGGTGNSPTDASPTGKPFDSIIVGHVDTVNTTNGTLTVDIPLVSYPQIGNKLQLGFSLHYETPAGHSGPAACDGSGLVSEFCGVGGWYLVDDGNMSVSQAYRSVYTPPSITNPTYPLRVIEPSGIVHFLGYDGTAYDSVDATGIQFIPSSTIGPISTSSYGLSGSIVAQDGTMIVVSDAANTASSAICEEATSNHADINCESLKRTDSNGNTITFSKTNGWVDTVGRNIHLPVTAPVEECPSGPQPITYALQWTFPGYGGSTYPVLICYSAPASSDYQAMQLSQNGLYPFTHSTIQSIVLPDNTSWLFTYAPAQTSNVSGVEGCSSLESIKYPSGATVSYTYAYGCQESSNPYYVNNPPISTRTENSNDGTGPHVWHYSNVIDTPGVFTVTDPTDNDTVYTLSDSVTESTTGQTQVPLGNWIDTRIDWYQGTSSSRVLLKSVIRNYLTTGQYLGGGAAPGACPISNSNCGAGAGITGMNLVLNSEQTSLPGGLTSEVDYIYDSAPLCLLPWSGTSCAPLTFGRITSKKEYNFGQGARGALLRATSYTYQDQVNSQYLSAHILSLLQAETIYNGSGAAVASSTYGYDENNGSPQGVFGNRTSENAWLNTSGGSITDKTIYNTNGMPVQVIDPLGNATKVSYDSTGIFPYQITGPKTGSTQHIEYYTHDATTGLLTSHTDENNQVTQYTYNDPLYRMTSVKSAVNTSAEAWVTYSYPSLTQVNSAQDQIAKGDGLVKATVITDGFGKPLHSQITSDASGTVYTDIVYDGNGREYSVSNQYRSILEPTYGIRTYTYDAIGRPTQQTDSDGVSSRTWTYVGNLVKYADENNNLWQRTYDAAGRMTSIVEPGSLVTNYNYDVLDNILSVNQLGNVSNGDTPRIRSFSYDSLSRLLCASNPEISTAACPASGTAAYVAGTTGYGYDADGNEITKTSPAVNATTGTQTIGYCYDALNRVTYKFPTGSFSCANPSGYVAFYSYDSSSVPGAANVIGRLTDEQSFAGGTLVAERKPYAYDPMGRLLNEQQYTFAGKMSGTPYSPAYTYNLAGNLTSSTSGVGPAPTSNPIVFSSTFDGAGRLQSVTSNWVDGTHPLSLFSAQVGQAITPCSNSASAPYTPFGGLMNVTFGNGLTLNRAYDKRMRTTCEIDTGSGVAAPTAASTTITIIGAEQSK
jgi:YD repeat-containing protein